MPIVSWDRAKGGSLSSGRQGVKRTKKKKETAGYASRQEPRSDVTFTRGWEEKEQRKVKVFLSFSLSSFLSFFFCASANLSKGIRYESNGVARNGLTRCIAVSRFAPRTSGCPHCLAASGLNRFRRARLFGKGLLIILPIINSDCGARAGNLKGGGQRDRRIRLMPTRLVFCTLFLRYFLNSLDSLLLPRCFFRLRFPREFRYRPVIRR